MTNQQTLSWIFLAIALASSTKSVDAEGIIVVADGINHAIPTQKELQKSISWLRKEELIVKQGKNFELSSKGKRVYEQASRNTNTLTTIWENLEMMLNSFEAN